MFLLTGFILHCVVGWYDVALGFFAFVVLHSLLVSHSFYCVDLTVLVHVVGSRGSL